MNTDFFTIREFAEKLKVHENTIRRAIKNKKIQPVRIGNRYRIPYSEIPRMVDIDLEEYIEKEVQRRLGVK